MKKKLLAIMLVLSSAAGTTAFAGESITALTRDNSAVIKKQAWMEDEDKVILSFYDTEGKLKFSDICTEEDDGFHADIPEAFGNMSIRACFMESGRIYDISLEETDETSSLPSQTPQVTEKPSVTETPSVTLKPEETEAHETAAYPSVYKSAVAAKNAFAVVESVSAAVVDGEDKYLVKVLYQGTEKILEADTDITISSASDYFSYLEGQKITSLKKGDVIFFSYNLSKTKLKEISFITRPVKEEIALSEENYGAGFSRLISQNGMVAGRKAWGVVNYNTTAGAEYSYAFGIITDRSGTTMTLYPKSGLSKDICEIDLDRETIVYTCDISEKNRLEVTGLGGIAKTAVPKRAYDDEENLTFTSEYKYNYALVRMSDGTATDVMVWKY